MSPPRRPPWGAPSRVGNTSFSSRGAPLGLAPLLPLSGDGDPPSREPPPRAPAPVNRLPRAEAGAPFSAGPPLPPDL